MAITLKSEIILASASKTRIEMLERHGLFIKSIPATIDEEDLKNTKAKDLSPDNLALFLAKEKAYLYLKNILMLM